MTLYLLYIAFPMYMFNQKYKYLVPDKSLYETNGDKAYGLYAWTTKKKRLKRFLRYRDKNTYILKVERDPDKSVMESVRFEFNMSEIVKGDFSSGMYEYDKDGIKDFTLWVTKYERQVIKDELFENKIEFGLDASFPYRFFTGDFILVLDKLGYTYIHDTTYATARDMEEGLVEDTGYAASYGLTRFNNKLLLNYENAEAPHLYVFFTYPICGYDDTVVEEK